MNLERWQRVQEIFHAAEDQRGANLVRLLDSECGDDADLRGEVLSLLESTAGPTAILEGSIRATAEAFVDSNDLKPGDRIGSFEIVKLIGSGGMGVVYQARRAGEFEQLAAIKLLRFPRAERGILLRFRAERQILANLVHPNIARLLDGGVTSQGQPYLVMEFVDGLPLVDYCRQHQLGLRQRLELFCRICAGVQCAHQNLVVHRDIKPANILVTEDGTPKLLDFGIAKLLDPQAATHTVAVTAMTDRLMTPEYASPEQVRGEAITTASDVYSLGVLLYELIAGQRPFTISSRGAIEIERAICTTDAQKPSVAAKHSEMPYAATALRGDIDNIVLKAMHKEIPRRYVSAADLSQDVARYLNGYPVTAHGEKWTYKFGKFVRRNRMLVATASLLLLSIIGAAAGMALLARQARLARDRAEQVSQYLVDIFQEANPENAMGREITARQILDKGAAKIDSLKSGPEVKAKLLETFGLVYENLGAFAKSRALLEQGLDLSRKLNGSGSLEEANMLKRLAELDRSTLDYPAAEKAASQSVAIRRKLLGDRDPLTAESLNSLALVYHETGRLKEAEKAFLEVLALRESLGARPHLETAVLSNLGGVYQDMGDYPSAEKYLRECVEIRRRTLGNPHPRLALALGKLANVLQAEDRMAEAEPMILEVIGMRRKLYGDSHSAVADSLVIWGQMLRLKGDFDGAEKQFAEARQIVSRTLGTPERESKAEFELGLVYEDRRDFAKAEQYLRLALEQRRKLSETHVRVARARLALGRVLLEQGRIPEAAPEIESGSAPRVEARPDYERQGQALLELARLRMAQSRTDEAQRLYRESIERFRPVMPASRRGLAQALAELGGSLCKAGEDGAELAREGTALLGSSMPRGHWLRTADETAARACR